MIPFSSPITRALFRSATWRMQNGHICLTFDDGPHPRATPEVLRILNDYGVKGTFFFVGKNVRQHPEIAREAASKGHDIGNHSRDHSLLLFRSRKYVMMQITEGSTEIAETTGLKPILFRPPYGYFRPDLVRILRETGHRLVMWSVDSGDWRSRPAHTVSERILKQANPGSIILLHDNARTAGTIGDILKRVLDSLLAKYELSPLSHDR